MIIDNCDHAGHILSYNKSLCIIKKLNVLDMPESVKDKIEFLLGFKQKFTMDEIQMYFEEIFNDKKELTKFTKRY